MISHFFLPGIACNGAHPTEEYGDSNNYQTKNSTNPASISVLECDIEHFSNRISSRIIVFTQQIRYTGHCKRDPNKVAPPEYDRYQDRAYNPLWTINICIPRFLCLENTSLYVKTATLISRK